MKRQRNVRCRNTYEVESTRFGACFEKLGGCWVSRLAKWIDYGAFTDTGLGVKRRSGLYKRFIAVFFYCK